MKTKSMVVKGLLYLRRLLSNSKHRSFQIVGITVMYAFALSLLAERMTFGVILSGISASLLYIVSGHMLFSLFTIVLVSSQLYLPAKSYPFEIASIAQYRYDPFPGGIFDSVNITITDIFSFFIIIYLVKAYILGEIKISRISTISAFFYLCAIGMAVYSTVNYSPYASQGLIISLQQTKIIVALISTGLLLKAAYTRSGFYFTIMALYIFTCTVGTIAFARGLTTIGILSRMPTLDTEQLTTIVRAGGIAEANTHALYVAILMLVSIPFVWKFKNNYLKIGYTLIGVFNIISAQSRTVWIGCIALILVTAVLHKEYVFNFFQELFTTKFRCVYIALIAILFVTIIIPRITQGTHFFSQGGGGLRLQMLREGLLLLALAPVTGFGVGAGVRIFFDHFPRGYIYTFPHPIHNGYLQIALESGIPALIMFLAPFYLIVRRLIVLTMAKAKNDREALLLGANGAVFMCLLYYMAQPIFLRNDSVLIGTIVGVSLFYLYDNIS